MKKIWDKPLYRDAHYYSGFPSVVALDGGGFLLAFRRAPDPRWLLKNFGLDMPKDVRLVDHVNVRAHIVLQAFSAAAEPVGDARIFPIDGEAADQEANLFRTRNGRIIHYGFCWLPFPAVMAGALSEKGYWSVKGNGECGHFMLWGSYTSYSDDGGKTWSPRVWLDPHNGHETIWHTGQRPIGPPVRGRMAETEKGELYLAAYAAGMKGSPHDVGTLYKSLDGGLTWTSLEACMAFETAGVREPSLAYDAASGLLTIFARSAGYEDEVILATFDTREDKILRVTGAGFKGHPLDPLRLKNGTLLLTYGYRHAPYGVRCRLIQNSTQLAGVKDAAEFIIREDGIGPDLGYPWAVEREDGRVLVVYYCTDATGVSGIEASLLEP